MGVVDDFKRMYMLLIHDENYFHFENPVTNKLYFFYCWMGHLHFDKTVCLGTKIVFIMCGFITTLTIGLFFASMVVDFEKVDKFTKLNNYFTVVMITNSYYVIPFLMKFFYGEQTEASLHKVDEILMERSKKPKCENMEGHIEMKPTIIKILVFSAITACCYLCASPVVILFFYSPEAIKRQEYYLAYVYHLEEWGNVPFFLWVYAMSWIAGFTTAIVLYNFVFYLVFYAALIHNESLYIANDLQMPDVDTIEDYNRIIHPKFKAVLKENIIAVRRINNTLDNFQPFFQTTCGLQMALLMYVLVVHALAIVVPETSPMVKFREAGAFLLSTFPGFINCWTGSLLEDVMPRISDAFYFTPWYWSTKYRKDVYIAICETQNPRQSKAFKVYPLELSSYLRFLNTVQSVTNLLRLYIASESK